MPQQVIDAPAGFVPLAALAFGAPGRTATPVDAVNPLPVAAALGVAASAPLAGTTDATTVVGPFLPQLGRPIWLSLSGGWTGTARILRSTDGGVTRLPLTHGDGSVRGVLVGDVNAPVAEETVAAASYFLAVTIVAGTLAYRMEQ